MLAEECPNSACFGVPLVRPPKAGGGKDSRKVHHSRTLRAARLLNTTSQECVICHGVYVSEKGASGYENLVALGQITNELPQTAAAKAPGSSGSARNGKSVIRDPSPLVSTDPPQILHDVQYEHAKQLRRRSIQLYLYQSRHQITTMYFTHYHSP